MNFLKERIKNHVKDRINSKILDIYERLKDDMRKRFVAEHLQFISNAVYEGIDVRGYCYWSLTDTYEWFEPLGDCRMGLVEVDFETGERTPREAFYIYQKVIEKYHLTKNF